MFFANTSGNVIRKENLYKVVDKNIDKNIDYDNIAYEKDKEDKEDKEDKSIEMKDTDDKSLQDKKEAESFYDEL
jgi:hypothetical protein